MPWARTGNTSPYYTQTLEALTKHYKVSMTTPWYDLPEKVQQRHSVRHAAMRKSASFMTMACARYEVAQSFEGVVNNIERRWKETD